LPIRTLLKSDIAAAIKDTNFKFYVVKGEIGGHYLLELLRVDAKLTLH